MYIGRNVSHHEVFICGSLLLSIFFLNELNVVNVTMQYETHHVNVQICPFKRLG